MMLNDRRCETQIAFTHEQYAVVGLEGYRWLIITLMLLLAFALLRGAIGRFLLVGFVLLGKFLWTRIRRILLRQLPFLAHGDFGG